MNNVNHILQLFKEKRIKKISDRMYQVDDHTVFLQTKKGQRIITCSCCNHSSFCNTPVFCRHKEASILYPLLEKIKEKIEKEKIVCEGAKLLKTEINPYITLDFLNDLLYWK